MITSVKVIKNDAASNEALNDIFNHTESPKACALYGGGGHCTETRVDAKIKLWGGRAEGKSEDACMVARIITLESEPAAMFNIGVTGNPPTVIDRTREGVKGSVYEFSSLMMKDKFFEQEEAKKGIIDSVKDILSNCKADAGHTKAILTTVPHSPLNHFLVSEVGVELTEDNIGSQLGENSLHPERFKLQYNQYHECSKWDKNLPKVTHTDWHESDVCVEWQPKVIMVAGVSDGHIETHHDL